MIRPIRFVPPIALLAMVALIAPPADAGEPGLWFVKKIPAGVAVAGAPPLISEPIVEGLMWRMQFAPGTKFPADAVSISINGRPGTVSYRFESLKGGAIELQVDFQTCMATGRPCDTSRPIPMNVKSIGASGDVVQDFTFKYP